MRLSKEIGALEKKCVGKKLTLKQLIDLIGPKAAAVVTFVLSLPFFFLIPLPGLSIVLGFFIFLNGFQIARKKPIWLPKFLGKRRLSAKVVQRSLRISRKTLEKLEKVVRPRGKFLNRHPAIQVWNGGVLAFCGFLLALPLPPGTNFTPGLATALMSLGILEDDGVVIILGYIAFVINLFFFFVLPIIGYDKIKLFLQQTWG